jgi:hypothetical protein
MAAGVAALDMAAECRGPAQFDGAHGMALHSGK